MLERCLQALLRPIRLLSGAWVRVGASFGVAQAGRAESIEPLLQAADAAMYRATRSGKGRIWVAGTSGEAPLARPALATLPPAQPVR